MNQAAGTFETVFEKLKDFVLRKLETELPPYLVYHNVQHTLDVLAATDFLGQAENVDPKMMRLLQAAALFHDTGFLTGYDDHEERSCALAREILPSYNFSNYEIENVCRLIMATRLPQTPNNLAEEIICDADLYYLGTHHYETNAGALHKEFLAAGKLDANTDFSKLQIEFLKSHRFFTLTAMKQQDVKKKENLQQMQLKQELAKTIARNKHPLYLFFQDAFFIITGILIAGFALKSFLVPNQFFDGGMTGISLLLHHKYHLNLAYIFLLVNLPFIILGYYKVGKKFAVKTFGCIALFGLCLLFVPYPQMTSDKLLISIFGGFFIGMGIGLIMRAGCALDGVEILALYTFKKTSFTVTELILVINVAIFTIAAFMIDIETALYSVLTYFTASKTIDFVVEGIEAYNGVTIISGKSELIKYRVVNELGKGITVYKGERGFLPGEFETSSAVDIIFTVVTRLELRKLKNIVHETDPKAFVFANSIREASGGILSRRAAH